MQTNRFYPILTLFICVEAKKTLKDRQEDVAQLKEQIGILEVERDAEAQSCERLKLKIVNLRDKEEQRGAALDTDKNEVSKLKLELVQNLLEHNAVLRSSLASARRMLRTQGILTVAPTDLSVGESQDQEKDEDVDEADETTLRAELDTFRLRISEAGAKMEQTLDENRKLQQNLDDTLKEFGTVDSFSTDLQTQFEMIHEWYETFERWNQDGKCPSCETHLDVAAIIDKRLAEARNDEQIPQDSTSISAAV